MLKQTMVVAIVLMAVASCRNYDLGAHLTSQQGLVPADQFARYGGEQAEEMAIAREFGAALKRSSGNVIRPADEAARYARSLPDLVDVQADPPGLRLTLRFKSGWRTM